MHYIEKQYEVVDSPVDLKIIYHRFFRKVKGKILDVGCNVGNFISLNPRSIIGIEKEKECLKISKERGFDVKFMDINKSINFKNNYFSAIYCSHVIEHLEKPLNVMREFYRILKVGGKLILITPDFISRHDKKHKGFYSDYTHKQPFTMESLKMIAYDSGFRKFNVTYSYKHLKGLGWLVRHNVIKIEQVIKLQNFLYKIGIRGNDLILVVEK